jgi:hypothetical protein
MVDKIETCEKLIFLDFDGVITTFDSLYSLDKEKLDLLGKIIDTTDCWLVISSSWREYDLPSTIESLSDEKKLFNNGMKFPFCDRIIGVTDRSIHRIRGREIAKWIKDNDYKGKYIILDDDDDMLKEQQPFFIKTDQLDGLSEADVEKAINILNS